MHFDGVTHLARLSMNTPATFEQASASRTMRRVGRLWGWGLALGLLLYGVWSFPLSLFGPERSRIPGTGREPLLTNYMLEHFDRWATGRERSYWDAPFNYPCPSASMLTDDPLATAPIYSAFRRTGFNRESAYQLWLLSMFVLNYVCCFLVLRAWSGGAVPAACGAYVFAFGIHNIGLLEQAQVMPKFMVPVALWLFWKALAHHDLKALLLTVVAVSVQLYCSLSMGTTLALTLLFLGISSVLLKRRGVAIAKWPPWRYSVGLIALLALVLLFPLLNAWWHAPGALVSDDPLTTLPHIRSYFSSHPAALSWQDLSRHGSLTVGGRYFMGGLPWLAILFLPVLLMSERVGSEDKRVVAVLSLTLLFCVLFFLRFSGTSLSASILPFPVLHTMRALDAAIHVQGTLFVIIPVLLIGLLRMRPWITAAMAVLVPLAVVVDNRIDTRPIVCYDKYVAKAEVEDIARSITQQLGYKRAAITYDPVLGSAAASLRADRDARIGVNAMLAAQRIGCPITNSCCTAEAKGSHCVDPARLPVHVIDNLDGSVRRSIDTVSIVLSDGRWLVADTSVHGYLRLVPHRPSPQEAFVRIDMQDGRSAFIAPNNRSVCVELGQQDRLAASAAHLGDLALFRIVPMADGTTTWLASNDHYVSLDAEGQHLLALPDTIAPAQHIRFVQLPKPMR